MKKIAITGGIGSGKSFVCKRFSETFNIPIYFSDEHARKFMLDKDIQIEISQLLGNDAFIDGKLNKPYIREKFYTDKNVKNKLDEIISEKIYNDFNSWCEIHSDKPYILFESAIIFEKESENYFDEIITITVSEDIRKQRVLNRDNLTEKEYQLVLDNQISDSIKISKSNYVIDTTNLSEKELINEITNINKKICLQKFIME